MAKGDSTPPASSEFPRPFGPKYVLLGHVATGGMADVFLARQSGPAGFTKECVIKRILPHLGRDQQFVTMFLDEARLSARLNHPNIAQVFDLGQVGEDYFIAMEYVHGVSLERVIAEARIRGEHHLPYGVGARIVASIADGLEHAHNAADENGKPLGMVHRDVSPSNVVISFDGVPKLLDFGVAKAATQEARTEVGVVKGKVWYMAPEQMQLQPIDRRADVFSLGAVLYELTVGERPWPGDILAQVGMRILKEEPRPPTRVHADYPEQLETILIAALAKEPDERTASARALQSQLERFLVNTKHHATHNEVAAYLRERFADDFKRLRNAAPTPSREEPKMAQQPRSHTGPLTIGDPSSVLGEMPGGGGTQRPKGEGGAWILLVMLALVVTVGIALIALRRHELGKEKAAAPDMARAAPPPPSPPSLDAAPSPPAQAPGTSAAAPGQPSPPTQAEPGDSPSVRPLVPLAPPVKAPPKPEVRRPRPKRDEVKLPHLPTLPPSE